MDFAHCTRLHSESRNSWSAASSAVMAVRSWRVRAARNCLNTWVGFIVVNKPNIGRPRRFRSRTPRGWQTLLHLGHSAVQAAVEVQLHPVKLLLQHLRDIGARLLLDQHLVNPIAQRQRGVA